jgi:hypothetical protein
MTRHGGARTKGNTTLRIRLKAQERAICEEIASLTDRSVEDVCRFFIAAEIVRLRNAGIFRVPKSK